MSENENPLAQTGLPSNLDEVLGTGASNGNVETHGDFLNQADLGQVREAMSGDGSATEQSSDGNGAGGEQAASAQVKSFLAEFGSDGKAWPQVTQGTTESPAASPAAEMTGLPVSPAAAKDVGEAATRPTINWG